MIESDDASALADQIGTAKTTACAAVEKALAHKLERAQPWRFEASVAGLTPS